MSGISFYAQHLGYNLKAFSIFTKYLEMNGAANLRQLSGQVLPVFPLAQRFLLFLLQ
jgi:hypothetical protein